MTNIDPLLHAAEVDKAERRLVDTLLGGISDKVALDDGRVDVGRIATGSGGVVVIDSRATLADTGPVVSSAPVGEPLVGRLTRSLTPSGSNFVSHSGIPPVSRTKGGE